MADEEANASTRKRKTPIRPVKPGQEDQATVEEFRREGMGVAPKE